MSSILHRISKFRLAAIGLTAAAALLSTADLAALEWKQASLCHEFRAPAVALSEHLFMALPWVVIIGCQLATARRSELKILFPACLVVSLVMVLYGLDSLLINRVQGIGLWMPEYLFCDQWNWFDFTFFTSLFTGYVVVPFAGVSVLVTIVVLLLRWATKARLRG